MPATEWQGLHAVVERGQLCFTLLGLTYMLSSLYRPATCSRSTVVGAMSLTKHPSFCCSDLQAAHSCLLTSERNLYCTSDSCVLVSSSSWSGDQWQYRARQVAGPVIPISKCMAMQRSKTEAVRGREPSSTMWQRSLPCCLPVWCTLPTRLIRCPQALQAPFAAPERIRNSLKPQWH
jgi:hypothetical protein